MRETLETEGRTRLAYERAKAQVFLRLVDAGTSIASARERVGGDPGVARLREAYTAARIERELADHLLFGRLSEGDADSQDTP